MSQTKSAEIKTPMQIFKKHGAHYYEDDEAAIIEAMEEYKNQSAIVLPDEKEIEKFIGKFNTGTYHTRKDSINWYKGRIIQLNKLNEQGK